MPLPETTFNKVDFPEPFGPANIRSLLVATTTDYIFSLQPYILPDDL